MSIVVFWIQHSPTDFFPGMSQPMCQRFKSLELTEALTFCNSKRKEEGVSHVVISSENTDSVGQPGVSAVENGLLPDGTGYGWMKRRV